MNRSYRPTEVLKQGADVAEVLVSTEGLDRDQDRLLAAGARLDAFERNPVVLFAHNHRDVPIGRATAVRSVPGRGVRASWRWLEGDPFASRVRNAWDQGVLNACSVGFIPGESTPNDAGGRDFSSWELLEFSVVPVPANADAVRTLKALGLHRSLDEAAGKAIRDALRGLDLRGGIVDDSGADVVDIVDDSDPAARRLAEAAARAGASAWRRSGLDGESFVRVVLRAARSAQQDALRRLR